MLAAESPSESNDNNSSSTHDVDSVALETTFNLAILVLQNTTNLWLKPREIAVYLCKAGWSAKGFEWIPCSTSNKMVPSLEHF